MISTLNKQVNLDDTIEKNRKGLSHQMTYNPALNPLDQISLVSFLLGLCLGSSIVLVNIVRLNTMIIYMMSLSLFHFLEFYLTSKFNPSKVKSDSFLIINNGPHYLGFHLLTIIEALVERCFFPQWKLSYSLIRVFGFILMFFGQVSRSLSMITAGKSFSHHIAVIRETDHVLVTDGIYAISRHPSYMGFFWYVIGVQLLLLNPICLISGTAVLYMFFSTRIKFEEALLVKFFGDEYVLYRNHTPTMIPFIN